MSVCIDLYAGISINGIKPAYDSVWHTYLYAIPSQCFESGECQLTIKFDGVQENTACLINADTVKNGSYALKLNPVKVKYGCYIQIISPDTLIADKLVFTCLPIVQLEGDFGREYLHGRFQLTEPDSREERWLYANIKWRGGTTNLGDKHKRNYHVKFLTNTLDEEKMVSFFGLRSSDSWILDAAQVDLSRVRNRTSTDLWNDFARRPYYSDKEPEARNGARGRFVELFLNNRYMGIYSLSEPIDRKQLKLKKFKQSQIRGQLWKANGWTTDVTMREAPDYDNSQGSMGGYETKYPKLDKVFPTDYSVIHDAIKFVSESSDAEFEERVGDYFDMPVIVDYYILLQTIYAIDNCGKNMYWGCYDRDKSSKLTLAVWDLDATIGGNFGCDEIRTDLLGPQHNYMDVFGFWFLMRRLYDDNLCGFREEVRDRYEQLRKGCLHTDSLIARYIGNIEQLQFCGAAKREERRWSRDSDICYRVLDLQDEAEYMEDWIKKHMSFLDKEVFGLYSTGLMPPKNAISRKGVVFDLFGRPVAKEKLKAGLYIKDGHLFYVK